MVNRRSSDYQQPLLKMQGIRKAFPGVLALENVDFELGAGEVHALLGENGAGKSTLIKILTGAYLKDAGEMQIDGRPVDLKTPAQAQELGVSCVYQEFNLIPQLSVAHNILLGKEPELSKGIIDRRRLSSLAGRLLNEVGVSLNVELPVRALGLAQQQMVVVAKALAGRVKILIMDEPTSALSPAEIRELFAAIERLKAGGVGIVYITHRLEEVFEIADRVTVLRDGRVVSSGPASEISIPELIRLMVNRDIADQFPRLRSAPGEELLRVENLSRQGHFEKISFTLRRGEIVGLAGLLGAGRTALARSLFGADQPDSGRILVHGQPTRIQSPGDAIRRGMGLLTEDRKSQGLVLTLSVKNNISLPNLNKLSKWGVVRTNREESLALQFIRDLRIKTVGSVQKVLYLSGGHQQKVVLSKWLARETDILIFDEPTRGIDVASKVEIYNFMNRLTAAGAGILMISSELPEILGMSDRLLVMHKGRITAEIAAETATQEMVMSAALGRELN